MAGYPRRQRGRMIFDQGINRSEHIPLPGTLGNNVGALSAGILVGAVTPSALAQGWSFDTPTYTDETTDMSDAGASDVAVFPQPATAAAAVYFGDTNKFFGLEIAIGQAGTGTYTMTWQYYDGAAWQTLTNTLEGVADFKEAAATYVNTFEPPSDWAEVAVNSVTKFYVRALYAAGTVTQAPLLTTAKALSLVGGVGHPLTPGRATKVIFSARTASAANADSKFLLVNTADGSFRTATWTKATAAKSVTFTTPWEIGGTSPSLVVAQLTEDGTTEYANGFATLVMN